MQNRENGQDENEAWKNSRGAHAVEAAGMDAAQFAPPANRQAGNQKPRDHEERDDRVETGPEQHLVQRARKYIVNGILAALEAQMNVVQHHGKDAKPSKHIDAGKPVAVRGSRHGVSAGSRHATAASALSVT